MQFTRDTLEIFNKGVSAANRATFQVISNVKACEHARNFEDLSYQNAEWDGLVADLLAYAAKQFAVAKMRQLDSFCSPAKLQW